ncbi:MAG: hypothetical protein HKN00_01025 [Flavobacteriaceae bacterium]|nr:nitrous oxide reductase accessory protein NosL [Bacteroidia bacterium]MBT8288418.1 nitrous oxide reductase accessory protein NosL [Bacteroidia bacterium]NNF73738.1 hypothetical protein [Flavobacteriaceae bacterium]NNK73311.1 hypothetical protein [Flavobacteriaceae bacterium]
MKTLKQIFLLQFLLVLLSCEVAPDPIHYGSDSCHFCRMTIVDKIHAAEIVTKKGKIYKFDAIECMINFSKDFDDDTIALFLCNYYKEPEILTNAEQATFLISENIPSPMGAFLTAFISDKAAKQIQAEKGGQLFNWTSLNDHLIKD